MVVRRKTRGKPHGKSGYQRDRADLSFPGASSWVLALAIFYVGRIVVAGVTGFLRRLLHSRGMDDILVGFLVAILRWVLLLFVVIAALSQLASIPTRWLRCWARQAWPSACPAKLLSNFAAGVADYVRPLHQGDFVEAGGASGIIENISISPPPPDHPGQQGSDRAQRRHHRRQYHQLLRPPARRVDMVFSVSYQDDLRKAKQLLEEIVAADERVLKDPAPVVAVGALADSSVNFLVRPGRRPRLLGCVLGYHGSRKIALRRAGISIPFLQMDVHIEQGE